jgi:hypothetical protein
MSKTFYFLIWSTQTFEDFVNEIEYNKGSGYEIAPEIVLKGGL